MAKKYNVKSTIKSRILKAKNGTLFFNNSFPDFDDEYVGQILSNLVKEGLLHHLGRGVYLKTEQTPFGLVYPSNEEIAQAIAQRDGAQVIPTGATAQNMLGLSTQVPMNAVFLTSGSARKIKLGGRTITFRRAVPKNFAIKGYYTGLIVQALKGIGNSNLTPDLVARIQSLIIQHSEKETLKDDMAVMPSWIRKIYATTLKLNK